MPNTHPFSTGVRLAFRARFGWLAVGSIFSLVICSLLSAEFSGRQSSTVAMDVGLSAIRLLLPLILVLMTQEVICKEFERKYFLNTLSYPHPRHALLLGRALSVLSLVLGLLITMASMLALVTYALSSEYVQNTPVSLGPNYLVTVTFIGLDLLVLSAVATFFAVVGSSQALVLIGTLGFMLIARSFGAIIELLTRNAGVVTDIESYRSNLSLLRYLLPDLGALDVRMIALYGRIDYLPADWPLLVLSSLAYIVGLLGLAVLALQRKRFA